MQTAAVENPIMGFNPIAPVGEYQRTLDAPALNETLMPTIATPAAPTEPRRDLASEGISPVATRWIFTPIRTLAGLDAQAFGVWDIKPNTFFPLRGVNYDLKTHDGKIYTSIRRTSQEQMADIRSIAASEPVKATVNLLELDKLEDYGQQVRILQVLSNPHICTKYPTQLKNLCATCWRDYLENEALDKINIEFATEPLLATVAMQTLETLYNALQTDLDNAAVRINDALAKIDDKTSGKTRLFDEEFADIRNSHKEMPKFRTSTDKDSSIEMLAAAIVGNQTRTAAAGGGVSMEEVKRLIADANSDKDAEIARLRMQIEQQRTVSTETVKCGDTGGKNTKGEPCGNPAKLNGRCAAHPQEQGGNYEG